MRTTINLEDEIYKKLVNESIEKYGNTKKLSEVLNSLLREILLSRKQQKREDFSGMLGKGRIDMSDLRDESDRRL